MADEDKSKKLWGGRFTADLAAPALDFTESIAADSRMIAEDIWGSQAHAIMLAKTQIISEEDLREILYWLEHARTEYGAGRLQLRPELEDVHMNVEVFVREGAGPEIGGRLHTARSRNDQVVTDARMHLRTRLLDIGEALAALQEVLLEQASQHTETVMPGYTHTQHAQPISAGFCLSAYASMFQRDQQRLAAAYERTNLCPLGAAAIAGTSFPIDRELTARLLGFDGLVPHALDAVGSRDFMAEALSALAILATNLSRLAEELVLFSTYEYGMIELPDAYASGSSIMPQKKNPCIAELTRARTGAVIGRLVQILTMLKALPGGYNRDLQEDKPPLWDALDTIDGILRVFTPMLAGTSLNTERMEQLVGANFAAATELANFLVRERGLPFRTCHEIVGGLVATLISEGKTLDDYERVQQLLAEAGEELTVEEITQIVDPTACLHRQVSLGSTHPQQVGAIIENLQTAVAEIRQQLTAARNQIKHARHHTDDIIQHVLASSPLSECEM